MIVSLLMCDEIRSITLPDKVSGQYWLVGKDRFGNEIKVISIEGNDNNWVLKSNKRFKLRGLQNENAGKVVISPTNLYYITKASEPNEEIIVITEPTTADRNLFIKYAIIPNNKINIGRSQDNEIVISNNRVSKSHATIELSDGMWIIHDNDSKNGTFINNKRIRQQTTANFGDVIYIMGVKIILSADFIAVNNPDGLVHVLLNRFQPFYTEEDSPDYLDECDDETQDKNNYFYRSPRFKREISKQTYKIDGPPHDQVGDETPMALLVGPSATMGMASVTTGAYALSNAISNGNISSAVPSLVMSLSMLLGTIMWPIITKSYERKQKRKKEKIRQEKYKDYLSQLRASIMSLCNEQNEILHENRITVDECAEIIMQTSRNLWERSQLHDDFLQLRVGVGSLPLCAEIKYPERQFELKDDNLRNLMYEFCEEPKIIKNAPIVFSLFNNYISGIIGSKTERFNFVKGLIIQIATMYSYDEVKMVFLYDDDEFDFVRWIPHTWNDDRSFRFVATSDAETKDVSSVIDKIIIQRNELDENRIEDASPYYVIFVLSRNLYLKSDMFELFFRCRKKMNISVVIASENLNRLPKECSAVIRLDGKSGDIFDRNNTGGNVTNFTDDISVGYDLRPLAVKLSNTIIDITSGSYDLPQMLTFIDMYSVGKIEHLNALERWKNNDPTKSLQVPVGVNTFGDKFYLDLHEKYHGPHGLIAGMTGSGKSEFIITYILSLALNYHPYEVAFILIDYKGGGMAKAFEKLPHVAGIITNLDGVAIKRSLVSIESELKRRQAIFAQAGKVLNMSNIDIYIYQKAYRDGLVNEPLPHLFIISDEFAELKTQQQEFMAQLISAARIGRSLGVHLILATQKPSGVVDDQIWSNSRFRVCLKVQERSDSMDMLKRPDAAELADTGRFFLQVGYNEVFELGQSAWAGAPYIPRDKEQFIEPTEVRLIDNNGHVLQSLKSDNGLKLKSDTKQLDAIVEYLHTIAVEERIKTKALWLEPIEPVIFLDALQDKYSSKNVQHILEPIVGEYDIPTKQSRALLTVPISTDGNVILYGASGSGKIAFITTMLYDLIKKHTPQWLNVYVLDFGAETLRVFEKAPQIGEVILSSDSEKVLNLFKMLKAEISVRKRVFANFAGDYSSYCKESGNVMPNIIVIINNYSVFSELYEDFEEDIVFLLREGTKYGVYFVLTATVASAVRYKLLQNFKQLFVMQLNDDLEYSGILGSTNGILPSQIKGRGIFKKNDEIYEFQTAYVASPEKEYSVINDLCEIIACRTSEKAKRVPILPERVDVEFFKDSEISLSAIPIGVDKNSLNAITQNFDSIPVTLVTATDSDALRQFTQGLAEMISCKTNTFVSVFDYGLQFEATDRVDYKYLCENAEEKVVLLFKHILERHKLFKEDKSTQFDKEVFIIHGYTVLMSLLSEDGIDKLQVLIEKTLPAFKVSFIICDIVTEMQKLTAFNWYLAHCKQGNGIWLGDGVTDQYLLNITRPSGELYGEIGQGFGVVVYKGKYCIGKMLQSTIDVREEMYE